MESTGPNEIDWALEKGWVVSFRYNPGVTANARCCVAAFYQGDKYCGHSGYGPDAMTAMQECYSRIKQYGIM